MSVKTKRFGQLTLVFCTCCPARHGATATGGFGYSGWVAWRR